MFARASDILQKSAAELRELRPRGITGISIGTESGDDASLAFMNKGTTAAEALEACRRLDEAGIEYYLTYMTGLAGAGNGTRAAHATATLFNRLHPYIVGIVSLTLFPDTPLMREIEAGRFVPMSERERLEELRTFLKELTVPVTISANTVSNAVPLFGRAAGRPGTDDRTHRRSARLPDRSRSDRIPAGNRTPLTENSVTGPAVKPDAQGERRHHGKRAPVSLEAKRSPFG